VRAVRRASAMPKIDPRVDAYIDKAADFARPILQEIRARVHETCPDCEETMKWSAVSFQYKGMLCGMEAFKAHCMFGFWKAELVVGGSNPHARFRYLKSAADLPTKKEMSALIHRAMALNDQGVVVARAPRAKKTPARVPIELADALKKNKKAKTAFAAFSPSHQREYVEWITDAKREETRAKRVATALQWIAEGKSRNWKYE